MCILANKEDHPCASWLTILFTLMLKMLQLLRAVMLREYVQL